MIRRILRVGLGVVFYFVFLSFLLVGALKFRLLSPTFWKTSLENGGVYQELQNQVVGLRSGLEGSVRKQTGGETLPPELLRNLAPLLSLDKLLTADKFKELFETNIDRLFGYLEGKEKSLVLYLPVKEWNLPVAALGQPTLAKFTAQTSVEDVFLLLGMKPEQTKVAIDGIVQVKTFLGYLVLVWLVLLVLTVGVLVGHYLLGVGVTDRLGGTAWLLIICGFGAKLIGVGIGNIFEFVAVNSKPPLPAWGANLGRNLVEQFFSLGATIGLVLGVVGLVVFGVTVFLSKQGKFKVEEGLSGKKKALALVLGTILGFVVLGGGVVMAVVAVGGKVDFKVGSQTTTAKEKDQQLAKEYYKSAKGWKIMFPEGWEAMKNEKWEGVTKKPVKSLGDWAMIRIGQISRLKEVDAGGYIEALKQGFSSGKSFKNAVLVEEPYEEKQEGGEWRRFVFTVDFDDVVAGQSMRVRLLMWQYFPAKSGEGIVIMATAPVESWSKYEKIIKGSAETFRVGN